MKITTIYDSNGSRIDSIELTGLENKAIDKAIDIIKSRCVNAGYPANFKDWNEEQFRLLGIMRFNGGVDAVLNFAQTAEIVLYQNNKKLRGYA